MTEISLMDEDYMYHDQSSATNIFGSSSSEGVRLYSLDGGSYLVGLVV